MVVTRKPSNPLPAAPSRTPSQSGSNPTMSKGSTPGGSKLAPGSSSSPLVKGVTAEDVANGNVKQEDDEKPLQASSKSTETSSKTHSKKKKANTNTTKSSRKNKSYANMLTYSSLAAFGLYTLNVCPQDYFLENPVCKGLSLYREHVIDPYILPSFHYVSEHLSISPYVEKVLPALESTRQAVVPVANYAQQTWSGTVIPFWRWQVVPRLVLIEMRTRPWRDSTQKTVAPYINSAQEAVLPYLVKAQQNAVILQGKAAPYLQESQKRVLGAYDASLPYVRVAQSELREIPPFVLERVYKPAMEFRRTNIDPRVVAFYIMVSSKGGELRRLYVDQHLSKMWITVQDLARSRVTSKSIRPAPSSLHFPVPEETTEAEPTLEMMDPEPTVAVEVTSTEDAVADAITLVEIPEGVTQSAETAAPPTNLPEPSAEETPSANTKVTETSETSSVSLDEELIASMVITSTMNDIEPSPVVEAADPVPEPTAITEDDFDAFLADLGIEDSSESVNDLPTQEQEQVIEEDLIKQKKEETALKRAAIEARHAQWEEQVRALTAELDAKLPVELSALRDNTMAEFHSLALSEFSADKLEAEGSKALRNTEHYLKSLLNDNGKTIDEKDALWERVLTRVEDKFQTRAQEIAQRMMVWWETERIKEADVIKRFLKLLNDLGDKAQADLGMDYAWLDDVVTGDWTRYHALLDPGRERKTTYVQVQEGSHPSSPPNPTEDLIFKVQTDLNDVLDGFTARLNMIQQEGYDAIAKPSEEEKESIQPIPTDGETKIVDSAPAGIIGRSKDEMDEAMDRTSPAEGEVSILPIPADDGESKIVDETKTGIIGRSRDEVEEAMGRTSPAGAEEGEVSILPIDLISTEEEQEKELHDAQAGILGRGVGEVEEALQRASDSDLPVETESILSVPEQSPDELNAAMGILNRGEEEVKAALERAERVEEGHKVGEQTIIVPPTESTEKVMLL